MLNVKGVGGGRGGGGQEGETGRGVGVSRQDIHIGWNFISSISIPY